VFVAGQHGDESLAPRVAHHLYTHEPELCRYVDYAHINPEAAAQGLRHVGQDQNRAFGAPVRADATEAELSAWERADDIRDLIEKRVYKYVLDLHTSDTTTEPFFLAHRRNPVTDRIIGASTLTNVAMLSPAMVPNTLMSVVRQAISIEFSRADEGCDVQVITELIKRLVFNESGEPQERRFFNINRKIIKGKDRDPGDVPNFELCADGYYPILLGKPGDRHSYRNDPHTDMLCFAAYTVEVALL
jgi:succinylglutamate desuccinylase